MSVKIRLRRMGTNKKPFYRVIVADSRSPRNGRFIENLGYFNPCTEPITLKIDSEKAQLWLSRGAQPTDTARSLLQRAGAMTTGSVMAAKAEAKAAAEGEAAKA